jgi:hypothetical protein
MRGFMGDMGFIITVESSVTRAEFMTKFKTQYKWLLRNNLPLLYKMFPKVNDSSTGKQSVLDFIHANGRKPSVTSKDLEEKRLGRLMRNYCSPSQSTYDEEFTKQVDALIPKQDSSTGKQSVLDFIHANGRKPSRTSKDLEEKRLRRLMHNYCSPSQSTYDEEFKNTLANITGSLK